MTAAMLSSPACSSQIGAKFSTRRWTVCHSFDIANDCATFSWALADIGRSITRSSSGSAMEMASMSSMSSGAAPGGAAPGGAEACSGWPAAPGSALSSL